MEEIALSWRQWNERRQGLCGCHPPCVSTPRIEHGGPHALKISPPTDATPCVCLASPSKRSGEDNAQFMSAFGRTPDATLMDSVRGL